MTLAPLEATDRQQRAGGVWDYVSVSRINLWLKCPLAFKFRYIDGIDSPPSASQFLGRRVHAALEYFYLQRMLGGAPSAEQVVTAIRSDWETALAREGNPFKDVPAERSAGRQAEQLVTAYRQAEPVDDGMPLAVESALRVPLIDPFTGSDLGMPLVGIVDLVLERPGGLTIIDFKTSARGGRPLPIVHELQLSAYSYLLRQATGQQERAMEIRQLVKTSQPRLERYCYATRTEHELRRLFAVFRAYLAALERREFFFRPGLTCGSCEYLETACQKWAA